MSLNWDVSAVQSDAKFVTNADGTKVLSPVTNALIWLTMIVGMGSITVKNARDFYARVKLYESLFGSYLTKREHEIGATWVERPLTAEDVRAHIGLRTNVSMESDTAWRKRILLSFTTEAYREYSEAVLSNAERVTE